MPDVYDFDNYRALIQAWLAEHPRLSQKWLAAKVGVVPGFVSMVLGGPGGPTRDIALHDVWKWTAALGLQGGEASYFESLVRADSGPTLAIKRAARDTACAQRDFYRATTAPEEHTAIYASWVHLAVLELARSPSFEPDPEALAQSLWPPVEVAAVAQAIAALLELGALVENNGTWRADETALKTHLVVQGDLADAVRTLRLDQLDHAARAIDAFSSAESYTASVTVGIERERLPELIKALQSAHLEVIQPFRTDEPDMIVELVFALYPRSRP